MREEFLGIRVHDDGELAALLGEEILRREKLHHWPLSYVELVTLGNGRRVVYKAQRAAASVENAFYEAVKAPFLLEPLFLAQGEGWAALALPYIEIPPKRPLSSQARREAAGRWSGLLQTLPDDVPIYFDIGTPEKLAALLEDACQALPPEEKEAADCLRRWAEGELRRCYEGQPIGLLHGDLTDGNVVTDGEKLLWILDWQRPMRGPLPLETALVLQNAGEEEPGPFGRMALVSHFLWYAYAYRHLLPLPPVLETARDYLHRLGEKMGR